MRRQSKAVARPSRPYSWFETALERWQAANDLHKLGGHCISLLAEAVEHQCIKRSKASPVAEKLYNQGFIFIDVQSYWTTELTIKPSLWGEEALEILDDLRMPKKLPDLTPLQFDILRCAINTARENNLKTVKALRASLLHRWPKKPKSIDTALVFWANYEKSKKS
jgi:hypothetical protein